VKDGIYRWRLDENDEIQYSEWYDLNDGAGVFIQGPSGETLMTWKQYQDLLKIMEGKK